MCTSAGVGLIFGPASAISGAIADLIGQYNLNVSSKQTVYMYMHIKLVLESTTSANVIMKGGGGGGGGGGGVAVCSHLSLSQMQQSVGSSPNSPYSLRCIMNLIRGLYTGSGSHCLPPP